MNISSRTPEGDPNRCPVCGNDLRVEPSRPPGDAPCPSCGTLLWFAIRAAYPLEVPVAAACEVQPNGEFVFEGRDAPYPPFALVRPHLKLGRRKSCDICLPYPNVSGLHCELVFKRGFWTIRDLNSTNGVLVNGKRITEAVLYPGDRIAIARKHYTIEYSPPAEHVSSI
jgi:hypothetical protein